MAVADDSGLPITAHVDSASPQEVKLVVATIANRIVEPAPERLISDPSYDSDDFGQHLERQLGIEIIAPRRGNLKKPRIQHGCKLRRYKRHWKIDRLFAWLYNFRRMVVRYVYHASNFLCMVQLSYAIILLRHF